MSQLEFTQQYTALQALLMNFALKLTKDEEAARDLVQDTALKAYKYRKMYQKGTNMGAWLMTIMRNTFINDYRKRKRRQILNDSTSNNYLLNSGSSSVSNTGELQIAIEEVENILNKIDDWARIPLLMHVEGYKYDEIAQELEIPLGTVKSRIYFARKQLKARLGERA